MKTYIKVQRDELKKILTFFKAQSSIECIQEEPNIFCITFEHNYMDSLSDRIMDWIEYYVSKIRNFFRPKQKKHELFKPIHLKYSSMPINEARLNAFLNSNDFAVIDEDLGNKYTAYYVTKI